MEDAYLNYMTSMCDAQAKWHLEQYKRFSFYSTYYSRLKANKDNLNNSSLKFKDPTATMSDDPSQNSGKRIKLKSRKQKKKRRNKKQEESESEFELDQRFVEFLRQSSEFKKQRDAAKVANQTENDEAGEESIEYVDVLRKGPNGSVLPPTASNRKEIYEEKYGHSGTLVLSLETALQWKFNKFSDKYSPCLWPALPIRFL